MKKRTRVFLGIIVLGVLVALALPLTNLLLGAPKNALASIKTDDAVQAKAIEQLAGKCGSCHAADADLPFYANLPLAKSLVQRDIKTGREYMDYGAELARTDGKPVSEVALAKTEYVLTKGNMPPTPYLMMHWDAVLEDQDRDAILAWIHKVRAEHYATGTAAEAFKDEAIQPVPASVDADPAKVALGDKLFHDKRLSKDNTVSCASCHDLAKGGCDQSPVSTGVGDQKGGINSPTVFNAGLQFVQFWDGRAADLTAQADGPVNNPIEMASNWDEAMAKLREDPAFMQEVQTVYPDGLTRDNCLNAIATFESTLVTPNSDFDKYLAGDEKALTDEQKRGFELFKAHGCASCHVGKAMGGQSYERMGRKGDYFGDRGTKMTDADNGRFSVTKNEADRHKFKTPILRNVELTHPYLHDGSQTDLKAVVQIMAKYQQGETLADAEAESIAAFLKSLTGEYKGQRL